MGWTGLPRARRRWCSARSPSSPSGSSATPSSTTSSPPPRPARVGGDRHGHGGSAARVSLVERRPGQDLHGRRGSQAIGGLLGALALLTSTQLLLLVVGGLYVAETLSVMLQVASFRLFGKAHLPDGADPLPLRPQGMAGDDHRGPILDPRRGGSRLGVGALLHRLPGQLDDRLGVRAVTGARRSRAAAGPMRTLVLGAAVSGRAAARLAIRSGNG